MSLASILTSPDPATIKGTVMPLPLLATEIAVRIVSGLVIVETRRRFRNDTAGSIEATITFPVPLHATLCGLEAAIDGRRLVAKAQRKEQARETYEAAIDAGKAGVLHEELLRGIHMLSVGHLPAGKEIAVTSMWVDTLSVQAGRVTLRIPTTVGDIFGPAPLSDSDDLVYAPVRHEATLSVACDGGTPHLVTGTLVDGKARLLLDRPIDLVIANWQPGPVLRATGADGRRIALGISPAAVGESDLDMAVLLDGSGSMTAAAGGGAQGSKHDVMVRGLGTVAEAMRPGDRARLWMFGDRAHPIAETVGGRDFRHAAGRLRNLGQGTCIGPSIAQVLTGFPGRDLLLVTDGKSYDIDVQALARRGVRIGVVLVGEDALDAQVSYLAALTGGEVFIATGASADAAIAAAFRALRGGHTVALPIAGKPVEAEVVRSGMRLAASWSDTLDTPLSDTAVNAAIAALAASLAIPRMAEQEAAALAEKQGVVCHLTSLVLIDEAGEAQEGLPVQHKVPLMTPATSMSRARGVMAGGAAMAAPMPASMAAPAPVSASPDSARSVAPAGSRAPKHGPGAIGRLFGIGAPDGLASLRGRIDWNALVTPLSSGDLGGMDAKLAGVIEQAAKTAEIQRLAQLWGVAPILVCIGLLAWIERNDDRTAARIFRLHLGGVVLKSVMEAAKTLRLA